MNTKKILILIMASMVLTTGCESKNNEKSPAGFRDATTTEYKVAAQTQLDEKINRLQSYISQFKQLVGAVQSAIKSEDLTAFSIFDVIYQLNTKMQNQMPRLQNEKLFIQGNFSLKSKLLPERCQQFGYTVTSESLAPLSELSYAIKSCYTDPEILNVVTARFKNTDVSLQFNDENLKRLIPKDILQPNITECQFSNRTTEPSVCKNVMFAQSKNLIWFADLISQGRTEISFQGISKKSGAVVYVGQIAISANGKIEDVSLTGPFASESQ